MKTPYVGGRIQPKVKTNSEPDLRARVRELESARVQQAVNQKSAIRTLTDDYARELAAYEEKLKHAVLRFDAMVSFKNDQLQRQRWFMGFMCFLFLFLGMILGDALAPYNLR